ncbi:MAG: hypothetical protein C4523_01385 [Myxococcales bacterium]|nr:MAG: hypothetical protein C4523_01385 [Myxococcales bacterium]
MLASAGNDAHGRRFERRPVEVRVIVDQRDIGRGIWFDANDISLGGLYLVSDFLFEKGTRMALEFRLPGETSLTRLDGLVAWVNLGVEETARAKPYGMGIEFVGASEDVRERLARFIEQRG